jgi:hypothetical protein
MLASHERIFRLTSSLALRKHHRSHDVARDRNAGEESGHGDDATTGGTRLSLTAIAALLAAVASTAGVVYQIWPEHHFRAVLTVLPVQPKDRCYIGYLHDQGIKRIPPGRRNRSGVVLLVRANVAGVDRSHLRLSAAVYGTSNVPISSPSNQPLDEVFLRGAAISEQIGHAWVRTPSSGGKYYVHFELYSTKAFIAYANSRLFQVDPLPFNLCSTR